MKTTRPLLALLFALPLALSAQEDTLRVQTLTFDSITTRRGWWQFPDTTHTYRKVLMVHTLKCDAQTTQDQYACGEWDYLTYSYVYDHTGVLDSVAMTHPFFKVNQAEPPVVEQAANPSFDLYQRWAERRTVVQTNFETDHIAGQGTHVDAATFTAQQGGTRGQYRYTAAELSAVGLQPGAIDLIRFNLLSGGVSPERLIVRMGHAVPGPDSVYQESGLQTVYDLQPAFSLPGVRTLTLREPFVWDGVSDIVLDLAIRNQGTGAGPALSATDLGVPAGLLQSGREGHIRVNDDRVGLDPTPFAQMDQEVTLMFWCAGDPAALPANTSILEAVNAQGERVLNIHLPWSNGRIYWDAGQDGTGYDRIDKQATAAEYAGGPTHWAFTKNTATGTLRIYRNGVLWHSGTGAVRSLAGITRVVLAANANGGNPYAGLIDDVQVFGTELDAATIAAWMDRRPGPAHPAYGDLLVHLDLDEWVTDPLAQDHGPSALPAQLFGTPQRGYATPTDLRRAPQVRSLRPDVAFVQGSYDFATDSLLMLDQQPRPLLVLETFQVGVNEVLPQDTVPGHAGGHGYTYDPDGMAIDSNLVNSTTWSNSELAYFGAPFEVIDRYEVGRYITPYGIGLSLGPDGFTWVYDVTDYQHLLHDSVDFSAGNQQELIDVRFELIEGTPPREVVRMQRPWGAQASHSYAALSDDSRLPPVNVDLHPLAQQWAMRTRLTGHGHASNDGTYPHCCEWKDNTHYLYANGTEVDQWHIWQTHDCAQNPVYPQGGTWLGSREGWCPGDLVKDHWVELTGAVSGSTATLDYGITPVPGSNLGMGNGNYVVNMDLFEYGAPTHALDAEITEVKRPNGQGYFSRDNPICSDALVVLRNAGGTALTSATLTYQVSGGQPQTYAWTGNLAHMEETEVVLPIPDGTFWSGDGGNRFTVTVSAPNGGTDQHAANDSYTTRFELPVIYQPDIYLYYKTNNRPQENTYTIRNLWGDVVWSRSNLPANTTYFDTLALNPGCYVLELFDSNNDGFSYWADPGQGSGQFRIRQVGGGTLKNFEPEFGRRVLWAFAIGDIVGVEELSGTFGLNAYPNPTTGQFTLRTGEVHGDGDLQVLDARGNLVQARRLGLYGENRLDLDLGDAAPGLYLVRLTCEGRTAEVRVVKE